MTRPMDTPQISVFPSPDELVDHAAWTLWEACANGQKATVALAGGTTPIPLYERLAEGYRDEIPWAQVEMFFGDERAVPPDHEHSNFRAAHATLLSRVPIPAAQVHRLPADDPDLEAAAERYEAEIRRLVPPGPGGAPAFDLVWLGLGEDGHTASLFPGSPVLEQNRRLVASVEVPALQSRRLTFTLPLINAARCVQFLVTGKKKASAVRRVLRPAHAELSARLPAARVRPTHGALEWLLDRAAATELNTPVSSD